MDKCNGSSRFPSVSLEVILTQTDTTVGFLSQDADKLYTTKLRPQTKPFLKVFTTFATLRDESYRVPHAMKNLVRRSKKSTFIVKNRAFRVATHPLDSQLLRNMPWTYSTSANESGKDFERGFCEAKADIIIEDADGLRQTTSSQLFKLNHTKRKRLR
jgi:tRNA A37 threonylcarbamoyladenosine synthetase subunit TsaC/SUA5/YrdC